MNYFEEYFVNMYRDMPYLFYTYILLLGLLVGSFLNVVIYRLPIMLENGWKKDYHDYFHPENELQQTEKFNLITPRSRCPNCGHKISAFENIPLISYIFLGGKCKECKTRISLRYPLIELLTGILSLAAAFHYGPTLQLLAVLALLWGLIAISGIDFDKQIIPDEIVLPLLWLGILSNVYDEGLFVSLKLSIYGAVLGYSIPWLIYMIHKTIRKIDGMGHGDFKLYACLGAWLGVYTLPGIILISCLIGAILGLTLIFKKNKDTPFCFGPSITIAGILMLFWGEKINAWYLTLIN